MGKPIMAMQLSERLERIAEIIEAVDNRCMAVDGPVSPTLSEMTQAEISEIYALASCPPLVVSEDGCREIAANLRAPTPTHEGGGDT